MKKSLLALAVLGAFAGAASAQTNVTIYGIVDAAIERVHTDGVGTQWNLADGNSSNFNKNGSRLGFKGSEDLGGGLSAIFALESGFNIDNGQSGQGNRLFGRQAFVGLQGNFGAVKLGRQYTPMHLALDTIDPFNTGFAGNIENLFVGGVTGIRTNNTINYTTPNVAGFSGQVAYSLGEVAGEFSAGREWGAGLGYANGPLNVQFAYQNAKANAFATPAITTDGKVGFLGASYDLRVVKIHAGFQTNKVETAATGATTTKERNWMVGVSAPIGAGNIMASYLRQDDRLATDADADQLAIGYVHNLSKRTNVYTSYGRLNDKSSANIDSNVFNVGVQHRF